MTISRGSQFRDRNDIPAPPRDKAFVLLLHAHMPRSDAR